VTDLPDGYPSLSHSSELQEAQNSPQKYSFPGSKK